MSFKDAVLHETCSETVNNGTFYTSNISDAIEHFNSYCNKDLCKRNIDNESIMEIKHEITDHLHNYLEDVNQYWCYLGFCDKPFKKNDFIEIMMKHIDVKPRELDTDDEVNSNHDDDIIE